MVPWVRGVGNKSGGLEEEGERSMERVVALGAATTAE